MTWQEIVEGITRHRANPVRATLSIPSNLQGTTFDTVSVMLSQDMDRKINEIEWALQAIAEKMRDAQ